MMMMMMMIIINEMDHGISCKIVAEEKSQSWVAFAWISKKVMYE